MPMTSTEVPDGLTLERHRDMRGRWREVWVRRVLLCCVAALPLLALLNVFGQHPTTTRAAGPAASLTVTAPDRLRGGLYFQVYLKVTAHRRIKNLALAFDPGWWESITVNSIKPEAENERFQNGLLVLEYGDLEAGAPLSIRINMQVNPTDVGDRREDVTALEGSTPLVTLHRSLTVFP